MLAALTFTSGQTTFVLLYGISKGTVLLIIIQEHILRRKYNTTFKFYVQQQTLCWHINHSALQPLSLLNLLPFISTVL